MTTMSSKFFQGLGTSSSSIEVDYLSLSVDSVHCLAQLVSKGLQLNERQCQDLCFKLVLTVKNIQKLVGPPSGAFKVSFGPALKNLYRVLDKAKLLVHQCSDTDWCRAAVFQIHNERAFREVLLEVGLCYNVIYELTKRILRDWVRPLIQEEDLRQSSLFLTAPESEVLEDQETLKRRLQHVAGTSNDRNSYLARYLLRKLECMSVARMDEDFSVLDAMLWMNETEPQENWKLQRILGSGSGAMCVSCYDWLGIPCARKDFYCRVPDDIFRREAAILAQLNHPNIVKFFCCSNGPEMDKCFIAMELMEMSLDSLIESRAKAKRPLPILLVLDIMTQIARGVCYLHGLNIAHRDLKPLNVVVTETRAAHLEDFFCVKLVDFGMSKTKVQVSKSNTISIPGVGTTKYRAPEVFPQAQRAAPGLKRKVNWFQADAYSFGITCAVLLSLKKPFEDMPGSKLYEEILQGVRPELPGECPEALVALLEDCWSTNPQSRPGFAEICSRLEQCTLQELLRVSSEGLQGVVGCEYIETVSMKQSHEQSLRVTRVPYVHSQYASTVSCNSDAAKEVLDTVKLDEKASPSFENHSEDRQVIFLSELERKKRGGRWSRTMSSLAHLIPTDALQFIRGSRFSPRHKVEQKSQEFDVKPTISAYDEPRLSTQDNIFSYDELKLTTQDYIFPYDEVRLATQDFHEDMKLGDTGSGMMYKGVLPNGSVVAVKKVSSLCRIDDFLNEVVLLSGLKHKNLVTLKGCCLHEPQGLLVYEYVENLNVSQILLDKGPNRQMVGNWPTRLKICLGVAQGLHYLHALAHPRIIHGNITARTVFLDRNFDPKIGDFRLGLLFPDEQTNILPDTVAGTMGYIPLEYFQHGELSDKADVYSFGVLCLEIISGRYNCEETVPPDQWWLPSWGRRLHEKDRLLELIDPTLQLLDVEVREVRRVMELCLTCLEYEANRRPSMARIVSILQGDFEWDGQASAPSPRRFSQNAGDPPTARLSTLEVPARLQTRPPSVSPTATPSRSPPSRHRFRPPASPSHHSRSS